MRIIPYLTFDGTAEEAIRFYISVFGGEIPYLQRYEDTPMDSNESCKKKILHGVYLFNGYEFYFSDGFEGMQFNKGDNIALALELDTYDEIKHVYEALKKDGLVEMELQDTFWGATFASLKDKYGINWNLNFDKKIQQ